MWDECGMRTAKARILAGATSFAASSTLFERGPEFRAAAFVIPVDSHDRVDAAATDSWLGHPHIVEGGNWRWPTKLLRDRVDSKIAAKSGGRIGDGHGHEGESLHKGFT